MSFAALLVLLQAAATDTVVTLAINWNLILPSAISTVGAGFALWIALQNKKLSAQNDEIHHAVNSTATKLAQDKAEQAELIKELIRQNATMTESARAVASAGREVTIVEKEKKP